MNTIAQIKTFPTGTNAEGLAGRILKVGQFYSGTGNFGDWSFQDIELQDATGKIAVCLDKRPELAQDWNGANVTFTPGQHQSKPCGIIAEDHQPKARQGQQPPQAYRRVRVTPSATMEDTGGQPAPAHQEQKRTAYDSAQEAQGRPAPQSRQQNAPAPQQRQNTQAPPQRQQTQPQRQTEPTQQQGAGSTTEARRTLAKIATLYGLCYDAAVATAWNIHERHGYTILPTVVGIMADKYLMETIRRVSVDDLPTSNPAELKGRPLCDLIPFLEEALDANLARRAAVEEQAKTHPPQETRRPNPANPRQPERAQEPEPEPEQKDSWQEGLESDEIPF